MIDISIELTSLPLSLAIFVFFLVVTLAVTSVLSKLRAFFCYMTLPGTKAEEGLQTSDLRLSSSEFNWDAGFPASAILIAVIIKIDESVCCKLS